MRADMASQVSSIRGRVSHYQIKTGSLTSHGRIIAALEKLGFGLRILDVGTATGYLGAALRHLGFKRVAGIERHAGWAQQAAPFYDELAKIDIEKDPLPWPPASFDAIVCADVLEHVREPEAVLRQLASRAVAGGYVLVSLPNIAHWSVRVGLLFGRFAYVNSGILDREHLRFFTRISALRLLQAVDLRIQQEIPVPLPIAHWCKESPLALLWRLLERADWCLGLLCPTLFAYQFVFVARKPAQSQELP